jgi:hypothetical protein
MNKITTDIDSGTSNTARTPNTEDYINTAKAPNIKHNSPCILLVGLMQFYPWFGGTLYSIRSTGTILSS